MPSSLLRVFVSSFLILFFICENCQVDGRRGFGGTEQDWGYVDVRPHAHMFWWLYYTTAPVSNYTQCPLIIWLQGGPGIASSGYGVFSEIGPLDSDLNIREHSWVKDFNILFVDNPVGVGFSYFSDNSTKYASNLEEIGKDLITFFNGFLRDHPEFRTVPTYIFGESYGGKMAVELAYQIYLVRRTLQCSFEGIGLGNSYISPLDYISFYAPLAYNLGLLDKYRYEYIEAEATTIKEWIKAGRNDIAYDLQGSITWGLRNFTGGIDVYNFMEQTNSTALYSIWKYEDKLNWLLNEKVKPTLNLPDNLTWQFFSDDVHANLKSDFISPVTEKIELLLNKTYITVIVYNGMLDLLVNTAGTAKWLRDLKWRNTQKWSETLQSHFVINQVVEGYETRVDNLMFYAVLRAGHSVPIDTPVVMDYILSRIKKKVT